MVAKTQNKATFAQVIKINERLAQVIEKHVDGTCSYREGSDDTVAAELGIVSRASVAEVRKQVYGMLRPSYEQNSSNHNIALLLKLRDQFNMLVERIGEADLKIND